jgi:serine phosphatase RsbU (regulator of sigma subunit)
MKSRAGLVTGVLIAVATGAVAVALGVALLLSHIVDLRSSANANLRTGAYLDATINVERLVVDAETGLRGYVITGDRGFLAPERAAIAAMPAATGALERAAAKERAFVAQAAALVSSARSYLGTYLPKVIRETSTDPAGARSVATTALGKRLVDETRRRSAALEHQISARQASRERAARESANNAVSVAIVVLIALTFLTVVLSGVLGWLLVGRERARERTEELYRRTEQTALTLQESLLPARIPDVPSCELAIRFAPAAAGELVGGDFFDVFAVGPDHWAIVVGDVCGKGAGAAAVTAMARWTLRTLADNVRPPAEVLRSLNEVLRHHAEEPRFITIIYALLEVRDAVAHVRIACAGHPPAIAVSPSGEPAPVPASGDLLAVWPDIRLHQVELTLEPGASLVFYTDGVTDQGPGVPRSPERAIRKLHGDRSADALAEALRDEAERWTDKPRDDVAIVALRFVPAQAPGLTAGPAAA